MNAGFEAGDSGDSAASGNLVIGDVSIPVDDIPVITSWPLPPRDIEKEKNQAVDVMIEDSSEPVLTPPPPELLSPRRAQVDLDFLFSFIICTVPDYQSVILSHFDAYI